MEFKTINDVRRAGRYIGSLIRKAQHRSLEETVEALQKAGEFQDEIAADPTLDEDWTTLFINDYYLPAVAAMSLCRAREIYFSKKEIPPEIINWLDEWFS